MHPVLFQTDLFGLLSEPIKLHTYGVLIATGFLLAMTLASRQAEREGEDAERFMDLAFYVLLSGLIGARIIFIFTKFGEYMRDPLEIVMFWKGGLVWYGGFIGAASFIIYYCKKHDLDYFKVVDIFIPYMALAHAFGRLGCVAAGCCYGTPTDMPWGIEFPAGSTPFTDHADSGLVSSTDPHSLAIHPTQLYEAGAELALFWILLAMRPMKRFHGQLFLVWLGSYAVIRSVIEMFRGDKIRGVYILSTSQYISIGIALLAVWLFFYFRKQRAQIAQQAA